MLRIETDAFAADRLSRRSLRRFSTTEGAPCWSRPSRSTSPAMRSSFSGPARRSDGYTRWQLIHSARSRGGTRPPGRRGAGDGRAGRGRAGARGPRRQRRGARALQGRRLPGDRPARGLLPGRHRGAPAPQAAVAVRSVPAGRARTFSPQRCRPPPPPASRPCALGRDAPFRAGRATCHSGVRSRSASTPAPALFETAALTEAVRERGCGPTPPAACPTRSTGTCWPS